jgi:ion channel
MPSDSGRRRPRGYGLILLAIVALIAVTAIAGDNALGRFVALVILAAALLLALRDAPVPSPVRRLAQAVAILAVLAELVALVSGGTPPVFTLVLTLLLVGVTPVILVRRLVRNPEVTTQSLVGALCVYLLLGLFFALTFAVTAGVTGAPFFVAPENPTSADFVYFSFVTLATVGYGDFVARSSLGHMLAVTEALGGQLYLVTVVALLVSNFRPRRTTSDGLSESPELGGDNHLSRRETRNRS